MSIIDFIIRKTQLNETRAKIARNLFWAVIGKVVTMLGSLVVGIMVARRLGPEQYGLMNYVISYVFLFQTLSVLGLDSIEVREIARGDRPYQEIMGTAFCIKFCMGLLCVALCILTSWQFDADGYTTAMVAIYSASILANSLNVIRSYFFAIVQNEYVVKSEISRTLVGMCIKMSLLYLGCGLTWFVFASMFDWVLLGSGYVVAYRTRVGRMCDWNFNSITARHLVHESFPLLLTNAAVIIYQRIDQVMIGQMVDKASVGYFATAARFVEILIYVPMMLAQAITPVLVRIRKKDEAHYRAKAQQFMSTSFWLSLLVASLMAVLAHWVILFTFGTKYLPAVAILQVLSFKAASVALSNTAGAMIVIQGLQKWVVFRDGFGCLMCVVLNYLLLPRYGAIAAAIVAIISNLSAGFLADAIVPAYRPIFRCQLQTLVLGWKSLIPNRKKSCI